MFTVRDVVKLLREAKELFIFWDGSVSPLDPESALEMAAYGSFVVDKVVEGCERNTYELVIKANPVII